MKENGQPMALANGDRTGESRKMAVSGK